MQMAHTIRNETGQSHRLSSAGLEGGEQLRHIYSTTSKGIILHDQECRSCV